MALALAMAMISICLALLCQIHHVTATNIRPVAQHLEYNVAKDVDQLISLKGYDHDGDYRTLIATITTLPTNGHLYQLTPNFSKQNILTAGKMVTKNTIITSANTQVTGSYNRLVYRPPENTPTPLSRWDYFTYTVTDVHGSVSGRGIVTLSPATGTIVASDFSSNHDGWTISGNGRNGLGVTYEKSSRGPQLNYFIYSQEDEINIDAHGHDKNLWRFVAPSNKFNGNIVSSYGGKLEFTQASFSGDFTSITNRNKQGKNGEKELDLVLLKCSSCHNHRGITLAYRVNGMEFTGKPHQYSILLNENSGWLKDPKNSLHQWQKPTKCEMIEVLHAVSELSILGDYTKGNEAIGLDNVHIKHGEGAIAKSNSATLNCYCSNPGTDCPPLSYSPTAAS